MTREDYQKLINQTRKLYVRTGKNEDLTRYKKAIDQWVKFEKGRKGE